MTLSEVQKLEKEISDSTKKVKQLQSEIKSLNSKMIDLRKTKSEIELKLFFDFIEIGTKIEFKSMYGFEGSPYFRVGEIVQIVKKNKKSIVIQRINKFERKEFIQSDEKFRVSIPSIYYFFKSDKEFIKQFETYLTRKESIEKLGL